MKNIIYYISIFIVISAVLYISWILWFLEFTVFIGLYSIIFFWITYIYRKIRKKESIEYKSFLINFIKKSSLSMVMLLIILWSFWYYQNEISPATMSEITISNWEKILVFQEMSHIWSENYYKTVQNNLREYKKSEFVYFYEGVKPGSEVNMENFNEAIWIDFNPDLYKNFSKLYWVTFQDNSIYYNLVNNLDFNVDVWIDWIMEEYNKVAEHPLSWILSPSQEKEATNPIDINTEIINTLSELSEKQLKVLVFINKAILNALIKSDWAQELISDNFANKKLFDIILDWRNEVLASEIIKSEYNKIYVTYWKLHFNWVLKLLQENDENWKVTSKKEIISMK